MGRLKRFDEFRFVGDRRTMVAYDCDDDAQLAELVELVERDDLMGRGLLQSFAPDTEAEARNRGFRPR